MGLMERTYKTNAPFIGFSDTTKFS
jgi:hypothetical protein